MSLRVFRLRREERTVLFTRVKRVNRSTPVVPSLCEKYFGGTLSIAETGTHLNPAIMIRPSRHFPNYLRMYRRRLNLSQGAVAKATGISRSLISRHECWRGAPRISEAFAYAAFYAVPVEELFQGMYEEQKASVIPEVAAPVGARVVQ